MLKIKVSRQQGLASWNIKAPQFGLCIPNEQVYLLTESLFHYIAKIAEITLSFQTMQFMPSFVL
jgi:hypothetical protein